jgi:hypothetical protein
MRKTVEEMKAQKLAEGKAVVELLNAGGVMYIDDHNGDVREVKAYVVMEDGSVCPMPETKLGASLSSLYIADNGKLHMGQGSIGGTLHYSSDNNYASLHAEVERYNSREIYAYSGKIMEVVIMEEKEMKTIETINEMFDDVIEGINEFVEGDLAESMTYIMSRAQKALNDAFDGNHETANKVMEAIEAGNYVSLGDADKESVAVYFKSIVSDLWNKEYMTHSLNVLSQINPDSHKVMSKLNLDMIDVAKNNKNDLSEAEQKDVEDFMATLLEASYSLGGEGNYEYGWDENGRPFTLTTTADLKSMYYLDNNEFKIS